MTLPQSLQCWVVVVWCVMVTSLGLVAGQVPRPSHLSIVVWDGFPEPYDVTTDPWLLNTGLVGTVSVPTDGSCVMGPSGVSFAISALNYRPFADYVEVDGVFSFVDIPTSTPVWTPDVLYNCLGSQDDPCGFQAPGTWANMGPSGQEVGYCNQDGDIPFAFAVLSRECSLIRYPDNAAFTSQGSGRTPLVIDYEFLPVVQQLDSYLQRSRVQMAVTASVRTPGQVLSGQTASKVNHAKPNDAHVIGHAIDFNYVCSQCSPTGGSFPVCLRDTCMQAIGQAPTFDTPSNLFTPAYWNMTKGGTVYTNIGSSLRWGGNFHTPDWNHIDDNAFFNTLGAVPAQDKTWAYTRLRVQAELALICAGVSCVQNPTSSYPPITSGDIKATICQALSGVTAGLRGSYSGIRRLLQTETASTAGAQALYNLLSTVVTDLYTASPTNITNATLTLGRNYSTYTTSPAFSPAQVWTTQLSLTTFQVAEVPLSSNVAAFQMPDSYSNLLGLVFNATQGSITQAAFVSAAAALALPTASLSTNASLYPSLIQRWSRVMAANNLTSVQVTPNAFDGDAGLPIQTVSLLSNTTSTLTFQYIIAGSTATSTVTGTLVVNATSTVSVYALLTGCYPLLAVNATRLLVASNSTLLLNQSVHLNTSIPKTFSFNSQPDNCLFLQAGQLPLSAGGWLLTRANTSFGVALNSTTNGSIISSQLSLLERAGGSPSAAWQVGSVLGSSLTLNGTMVFSSGTLTPLPVSGGSPDNPSPVNDASQTRGSASVIIFVCCCLLLWISTTLGA